MSNKLILVFLTSYITLVAFSAYAESTESLNNKLRIIKDNIFSENIKAKNLLIDLKKINFHIKNTDKRINIIEKQVFIIENNKKKLDLEIIKIKQNLKNVTFRKDKSNKIIKQIIYNEYLIDENDFLYQLLNSRSNNIFLDTQFSQYISKTHTNALDLHQINENIIKANTRDLKNKIIYLDKENDKLRNKLLELNILENKNLKLTKIIKSKILNSESIYYNYINQEEMIINLLNNKNNFSENNSLTELKGFLPWPTNGEVSNNFNKFKFHNLYKWNGEVIKTSKSIFVRAVHKGEIIFSDWIKGYGMIIIVDHGENLMSLYAHNKVLYKNKGDFVEKGEIISKSGSSGGAGDNSLYFEIRLNGVPQDPHDWCNVRNKFSLAH
jgi:septal ring factor EnvC (AmiA/AmiB activator)